MTGNRNYRDQAKEIKSKELKPTVPDGAVCRDIYAAYDGDEKHRKYWRSLQSVKPLRFHK